ncbi:MAG: hypothetical protein ACTSRC_16650 [Candidatus Helarchaeota archaeon]
MSSDVTIRDIWITDKVSGRCLFHKSYSSNELDADLVSSFLSGLNAFSEAELGDSGIECIEMGGQKWVYINWENKLLLVAAADKQYDTIALNHQLEVVRKSFMNQFNIDKTFFESWNGNVAIFSQFEQVLDELVNDFRRVSKVTDIAKMMNLLEVYQQILHAFAKVLPAIKEDGRQELEAKMIDVKDDLPSFFKQISYGKTGWNILTIDITSSECDEVLLFDGLQYILDSFVIEMKSIFKEDLFFEICKKLVYPKLLADWTRIRELNIDKFLLKLFLS